MNQNGTIKRTLGQLHELRQMRIHDLEVLLHGVRETMRNQRREIERIEAKPQTPETGEQLYRLHRNFTAKECREGNILLVLKDKQQEQARLYSQHIGEIASAGEPA